MVEVIEGGGYRLELADRGLRLVQDGVRTAQAWRAVVEVRARGADLELVLQSGRRLHLPAAGHALARVEAARTSGAGLPAPEEPLAAPPTGSVTFEAPRELQVAEGFRALPAAARSLRATAAAQGLAGLVLAGVASAVDPRLLALAAVLVASAVGFLVLDASVRRSIERHVDALRSAAPARFTVAWGDEGLQSVSELGSTVWPWARVGGLERSAGAIRIRAGGIPLLVPDGALADPDAVLAELLALRERRAGAHGR